MISRTRFGLATMLVGGALIIAGCGGGSSTSGTSSNQAAGGEGNSAPAASSAETSETAVAKCGNGSGKPATGAPIKVGAIVTESGGVDFSSAANGTRAYFDCLNENGGINGRPVEYITEDDGNDPEKSAADAAHLIQDEHVVAMVGGESFTDCVVNPKAYEKAGLISIMAVGLQQFCFRSPSIVPVNAGPRVSNISTAQVAVEEGHEKFAFVALELPGLGQWLVEGMESYLEAQGKELVKTIKLPPGVTNATAIVSAIKAANPDAVIISMPLPDTVTLMKAVQQQQLNQTASFYFPTSAYDESLPELGIEALDGSKINIEFAPLNGAGPETQLWSQSMERYESGERKDSFSQGGFVAARLFADSVEKISGPVTTASVKAAVTAQTNFRSDLACAPFNLTNGAAGYNPNRTTREVELTGGEFKLIRKCFPVEEPGAGG